MDTKEINVENYAATSLWGCIPVTWPPLIALIHIRLTPGKYEVVGRKLRVYVFAIRETKLLTLQPQTYASQAILQQEI